MEVVDTVEVVDIVEAVDIFASFIVKVYHIQVVFFFFFKKNKKSWNMVPRKKREGNQHQNSKVRIYIDIRFECLRQLRLTFTL